MKFFEYISSFFISLWEILQPVMSILYEYTLSPLIKSMVTVFKFINTHRALTIGIFVLLLYSIFSYMLIFNYDYFGYNKFSYITNIIFIIFGVIFGFTLLNKYFSPQEGIQPSLMNVVKRISLMLLVLFLLFGLIYIITYASFFSDTLSIILTISITIIGLYFINKFINNIPFVKKIKQSSFFSILYHIIFIIPCLIIEGSIDVYNSIKDTPKSIYRILGIEILLILGYFLLPLIINKVYTHNSKLLLNKPKYLDKQTIIGSFEDLNPKQTKDFKYKYNYSLSSWIYLDNIGPNHNNNSNGFMDILSYGNKPRVQYNPKTLTLRITTQNGLNGTDIIYETDKLPLQRWNHFVINYDQGNTDVFINNKLVGTKKGIVPYMTYDNVVIGQENGMEGGICNVQYYNKPLTKNSIEFEYSTLKDKTPPVIS